MDEKGHEVLPLSQKRSAKQTSLSPGNHAKMQPAVRTLARRANPIPSACPGWYGPPCGSMSQWTWHSTSEVEFEDEAMSTFEAFRKEQHGFQSVKKTTALPHLTRLGASNNYSIVYTIESREGKVGLHNVLYKLHRALDV